MQSQLGGTQALRNSAFRIPRMFSKILHSVPRKVEHPDFQISGLPEIRISRSPDLWIFPSRFFASVGGCQTAVFSSAFRGLSGRRVFHCFPKPPDGRKKQQRLEHIRKSGFPDFRISGIPEIRISGLPEFRMSGNPDLRTSNLRKSRNPAGRL